MNLRGVLRRIVPGSMADRRRLSRLVRRYAMNWGEPASQMLLCLKYREMAARGESLECINDSGFQVFSAADEDGILLYLFSVLGTHDRTFVDIGSAGIEGSNTANLVVNHGWYGLHIELFADALRFAQKFYKSRARCQIMPPKPVCGYVNAENVNSLIAENGISGTIDFLSIDIDGNDYWVWKAIHVIEPRVVAIELQPALGSASKTIPYDPHFNRAAHGINQPPYDIVYCGASLPALISLGCEKGYRFVGCDSLRINAFFVKDDIGSQSIPVPEIDTVLQHPRVKLLVSRFQERLLNMPWVDIGPARK